MFEDLQRNLEDFHVVLDESLAVREAHTAISHKIDDFRREYSKVHGVKLSKIVKLRKLLQEANLPLTQIIFEKESGLLLDVLEEKHNTQLEISAPVVVEAPDDSFCSASIQTECSMDREIRCLLQKHKQDLEEIRNEALILKQRHAKSSHRR